MKPIMRILTAALLAVFLLPAASAQDDNSCDNGKTCLSRSYTFTSSGVTVKMPNLVGGLTASFEEVLSGSPASVSIVIKGCKKAGTCDTLETNTSTAAGQIRTPAISTLYDYFTITPTWTGGTSVSIVLNATVSTSVGPTGAVGAAGTQSSLSTSLSAVATTGAGTAVPIVPDASGNYPGKITWQYKFGATTTQPTSHTTNLEGSIDNVNWFVLDTSSCITCTFVGGNAGEMRHIVNKNVLYLRCDIAAVSIGSAVSETCQFTVEKP